MNPIEEESAMEPQTERVVMFQCSDCDFKTYSDTEPDYVKVMHDHLMIRNHLKATQPKKE